MHFWADLNGNLTDGGGGRCLHRGTISVLATGTSFHRYLQPLDLEKAGQGQGHPSPQHNPEAITEGRGTIGTVVFYFPQRTLCKKWSHMWRSMSLTSGHLEESATWALDKHLALTYLHLFANTQYKEKRWQEMSEQNTRAWTHQSPAPDTLTLVACGMLDASAG